MDKSVYSLENNKYYSEKKLTLKKKNEKSKEIIRAIIFFMG